MTSTRDCTKEIQGDCTEGTGKVFKIGKNHQVFYEATQ